MRSYGKMLDDRACKQRVAENTVDEIQRKFDSIVVDCVKHAVYAELINDDVVVHLGDDGLKLPYSEVFLTHLYAVDDSSDAPDSISIKQDGDHWVDSDTGQTFTDDSLADFLNDRAAIGYSIVFVCSNEYVQDQDLAASDLMMAWVSSMCEDGITRYRLRYAV